MADITLTFSDGTSHIYKDAPDNLRPEDVIARAAKDFGDKELTAVDRKSSVAKEPKKQTIYKEETVYDPITGVPLYSGGDGEGATGKTATVANLLEKLVATPTAFSAGASKVMSGLGSLAGKVLPNDAQTLSSLVTEQKPTNAVSRFFNEMGQQSQGLTKGLSQATGSNIAIPAAEMAGEITASMPAGRVLADLAQKSTTVAKAAPNLLEAIRTSGGAGGGLLTRSAGGAIAGGASAGVLNPEDALLGSAIGGAIPIVGAGASKILSTAPQTEDLVKAIATAREAGYVIPPTQANPTFLNRVIEGTAGKLTTAQNASAKNQLVTNKLAANALGLADDVQITPEILDEVRKTAGQAYEALATLPVKEGSKASSLTNAPAIAKIDPAQMVYDLRVARNDSNAYYKNYERTADPEALTKARNLKAEAMKIETALENYAKSIGYSDLVPELRNARELIAKTYTVEKALNKTTGSVNAQKLASELEKGKPLTDQLKQVAQFAQRFKTASKPVESMGSLPQVSPLDFYAGVAGLGASQYADKPEYAALAGVRPAMRALALSPLVQNRLIQQPKSIQELLDLLRTATPSAATEIYSNISNKE